LVGLVRKGERREGKVREDKGRGGPEGIANSSPQTSESKKICLYTAFQLLTNLSL